MAQEKGSVLERLLAGVILIAALLWGASLLASPDEASDTSSPGEPRHDEERLPMDARIAPSGGEDDDDEEEDEDDDDDDDEEAREPRRKGKRGRGG